MKNNENEILKFNLNELSWDGVNTNQQNNEKILECTKYPCYDDMCFEGEVFGNDLGVTYQQIISKANGKGTKPDSSNNPEIKTLYDQELSKGGIWLKFTDYKDSVKKANNGKPYTFYVAKKPVLKNVSWYDLESIGMVYGTDTVDSNGPKPGIITKNSASDDSYGIRKSYRPTTMDGKNGKYQISLIRGRTNYGDKDGINSETNWRDAKNSQWNRSIVAITTSYRGENDSLEDALKTKSDGTEYTGSLNKLNMDLKCKTGDYNWFGDLTIGAWEGFQYNNKNASSVSGQGQYSLSQEYSSSSYRSGRGDSGLGDGAANSVSLDPDVRYGNYGFRPVLSPIY